MRSIRGCDLLKSPAVRRTGFPTTNQNQVDGFGAEKNKEQTGPEKHSVVLMAGGNVKDAEGRNSQLGVAL